jgi:hypothetical protein
MSDSCLLRSFSSSVTFIMLIMIMRMTLTTMLFNGLIISNIEWLPWMFRVSCKPTHVNQLDLANDMLNNK